MARNIVVCCDGTGNEFGSAHSNVVKLYQTLARNREQIGYYHPGVGTMGARNALSSVGKWWTRTMGLAFGYGISDNVADAYLFLMREFQADDKIYIFGFSRGAYTARVLCGMLHAFGLLTAGNEAQVPYAIRLLKENPFRFGVAKAFKKTFSCECKPHFLGVWDTVSSVGWVYQAVGFPFTKLSSNPDLNIVRHAISIDERRAFFRQNVFGPPNNSSQDAQEVWFAGAHSDVGGGYPEPESQLSKIALRWMLCEAEHAGMIVDQTRKREILGAKTTYVAPDPESPNQHESLKGKWLLAELYPKLVSKMDAAGEWHKSLYINLGRHRRIDGDILIHESVDQRLQSTKIRYSPSSLSTNCTVVKDRS
jgi:uncharacterized protein (DUF2235 family)